jgi:putative redox protein
MTIVRCETVTANSYPVVVHVRDHTFNADVATTSGGADSAPGPHDYFDAALATCKATTAMWYAKRHDIPLERVDCNVESDGSHEREAVYTFRVELTFHGPLSDEQRAQLHRAAAACPITKLMTTSEIRIETAPPVASALEL